MNWIKENYDRFLLGLFALALLACAGLLITNANSYGSIFEPLKSHPPQSKEIPGAPVETVGQQEKELGAPNTWSARVVGKVRLPVFDSKPYIEKDGKLFEVTSEGEILHPPVPNGWLLDNKQDLLADNVLQQDTDGDGFSTVDEWHWKTDPMDKSSHPPYWTKLVYSEYKRIPFLLRFDAKNGDVIQINTLSIEDAPTQFLHVGDMVKNTTYKIIKFEEKFSTKKGFKEDVSEVTLENQVDKSEHVVLPKATDIDSPTTYAVLTYQWNSTRFAVKKNAEFTIKPDDKVKYKCLSLNDTEVKVLKEDENKTLTITKNPPPGLQQ